MAEKLVSEIQSADVVLGLLDESSNNVVFELGYALGRSKQVIVVASDETQIPLELSNVPYVRLEEIDERTLFNILATVGALTGGLSGKENKIEPLIGDNNLDFRHSVSIGTEEFERTVLECFKQTGAEVNIADPALTPGLDFFIHYSRLDKLFALAFKRYSLRGLVSLDVVREILAAVEENSADGGMLVSTSEFTNSAREFAKRTNIHLLILRADEVAAWRKTQGAEWSFVWQKLIDQDIERDFFLSLGREWLRERENESGWPFVWQMLLDRDFELNSLLPLGREWLRGRENELCWPFVWQKLIDQDFERDILLSLGREWLRESENEPGWNYIWQKLIGQDFELDSLLPLGREWLRGRENEPGWPFVWKVLLDRDFELDSLLPLGLEWLRERENEPGWPFVWEMLFDRNFELDALLQLGQVWLRGRENRRDWPIVAMALRSRV